MFIQRPANPLLLVVVGMCSIHMDGQREVEAAGSLSIRSGEKVCELAHLGDTEDSTQAMPGGQREVALGCQSADESSLWT